MKLSVGSKMRNSWRLPTSGQRKSFSIPKGFEDNDEYVVPMVDYLSYRLHRAKIYRNRRRRERDIWWVWIQLKYEGIYVEACIKYYAKLVEEVEKDIYTILHREYVRMKRNQTSNKQ